MCVVCVALGLHITSHGGQQHCWVPTLPVHCLALVWRVRLAVCEAPELLTVVYMVSKSTTQPAPGPALCVYIRIAWPPVALLATHPALL